MSPAELVKAFMDALEAKDFDTASSYLADDFLFSGWTPQPLDRTQFMAVMDGLKEGIPSLSYNFHTVRDVQDVQQESRVKATVQMMGTQTESFILPPLGTPPIPQMAGTISMPEEQWNYTLENGKIARIVVGHVAGGGIQGLLHQLGVDLLIEQ